MAIQPFRGPFHVAWYPKKASVAFAVGDMVFIDSSASGTGYLDVVVSTSPSVIGTALKKVVSTDTDYASTTMVPVLVGDNDAEWQALVTGTGAQTDVGEYIDATDKVSLNVAAYTYGVALVSGFISTTQMLVKFRKKSGPAITTS